MSGVSSDDEIPLEGGNVHRGQIVRVGNTVRRPTGLGSDSVHGVLLHLEAVGFEHAPRFLGFDEKGREVLSFLPGQNVWESQHRVLRNPEGVSAIGQFVRELHDALASYHPPADAVWANSIPDPCGGDHVIHGDIGPWNLVAEPESLQCRIIDWDTAAPGRRVWELSYSLQTIAHMWGDPPPWAERPFTAAETAARLRAFANGYRLGDEDLVECVRFASQRSQTMADLIEARADAGEDSFVAMRDEGHAEAWAAGARAIETNVDAWLAHL